MAISESYAALALPPQSFVPKRSVSVPSICDFFGHFGWSRTKKPWSQKFDIFLFGEIFWPVICSLCKGQNVQCSHLVTWRHVFRQKFQILPKMTFGRSPWRSMAHLESPARRRPKKKKRAPCASCKFVAVRVLILLFLFAPCNKR